MKKSAILLLFITTSILSQLSYSQGIVLTGEKGEKYLAGKVVVKFRPNAVSQVQAIIKDLLSTETSIYFRSAEKNFPSLKFPDSSLDNIYELDYTQPFDPLYVAGKLKGIKIIEWAEPRYVYELSFTPNDPSLGVQWNLQKIKATMAWDVSQGDTSVVVGIIDTGVDWDHPDLQANIWKNLDEIAANGIDDDNNGYIDDYYGWDFGGLTGTPDNDPMEDMPDHGTHVAGIVSASTNNGIGIASIGFKSKIMAVKTSQNNYRNPFNQPYIVYGYEGITYASDNGADIVNCSWGGSGYSILGQEVINYVTNHGTLVVCAAGNNGSSDSHFPSGYSGALSVASTDQGDIKSSFSNYGSSVDVSAPGSGIYSTWMDNTYITTSGTSMASPLVAGLAALVKAKFPLLNPLQIAERIRVTCDNIDAFNPQYQLQLGKGRINAHSALTITPVYSVRGFQFYYSDNEGGDGDGIFEPGESIYLRIKYVNMLDPVSSLTLGLESISSYANIVSGVTFFNNVNNGDTIDNYANPFIFTISSLVPANTILKFVINTVIGGFNDFQWTSVVVNPTYATQSGNNIALTITSKGTFAFNDYPNNLQGNGLRYAGGSNIAFEGALILGTSPTKISDGARNASGGGAQNADFQVVSPFIVSVPGTSSDIEGKTIFNDNGAGSSKHGVTVTLHSHSFTQAGHEDYIILRFKIKNETASDITGLYAGLFFDFDLIDGSGADDYTLFDTVGNFGYVYHPSGTPAERSAIAVLSNHQTGYWGILNAGGDGGFQIYDGFSDAEKWQAISSGIGKPSAGSGDVSFVLSAGPLNITAGAVNEVAFVIAVKNSSDMNALRSAINAAKVKYASILTDAGESNFEKPVDFSLHQNYPNPFNPMTTLVYSIPEFSFVKLAVYDLLGREVQVLSLGHLPPGTYTAEFNGQYLSSGVYMYRLEAGNFQATRKMTLLR